VSPNIPPHDLDAEAAVLSALLLRPEVFDLLASRVSGADFYADANRRIFDAIVACREAGQPADIVTVAGRLRDTDRLQQVGGTPYLAQLADSTPAIAHVEAHAKIVAERARLRRVIALAQDWVAASYQPVPDVQAHLDQFETGLHEITQSSRSAAGEFAHESFAEVVEQAKRAKDAGGVSGVATGYLGLDRRLTGLHPGDLYVIAGRPGMAKTSLAIGIAANIGAAPNLVAAFFSLEMPRQQLAARLLTVDCRVDLSKLRSGQMGANEWSRLTDSAERLAPSNVWIDDTPGITLMEFRGKLRQLQAETARAGKRVAVAAIDYLQLMRGPKGTQSREQEVSELSRGLKAAAKEFGIPIIALSQLNRGCETRNANNKRPQLSDLRDSGAIEQDADAVAFLYRDEYYNPGEPGNLNPDQGIAEIIIAKQRNGPTGTERLRFAAEFTRFDNLAADYDEPPNEYGDFEEG